MNGAWIRFIVVVTVSSLFSLVAPSAVAAPNFEVVGLTTDYRVNPLADDAPKPVFGWQLRSSTPGDRQTAYQLQVWTIAAETVRAGPVWDSGRVSSSDQVDVVYAGPVLESGTRYHWQVRTWGLNGQPSVWSQPAWWETGLGVRAGPAGGANDWSSAQWISATQASDAPLVRKQFTLAKPVASARAYVFGLGWYELHLNGRKVGDQVLTPADTQYQNALLYDTYDATDYVHVGDNAVGAWLGNGYGSTYSRYGWRWLGPKQVLVKLAIRFTDGTTTSVVSDPSWKWSSGPITSNDIYNGETYDARLAKDGWDASGYDDTGWATTVGVAAPSGALSASTLPPIRVDRSIRPVALTNPKPGAFVFDLGANMAGWIRLRVTGIAGTRVQARFSEDLAAGGSIDRTTNRNAAATDVFILGDVPAEQVYEPRFTYHGFRYVELTGLPGPPTIDTVEGRSVHADLPSTGTFRSSDPLVDQIHNNARRTILNNSMSIPTDNPVRDERTPPGMDVQSYAEAAAENFDVNGFYTTYMADIAGHGLGTSGYFAAGASPDMNGAPVLLAWLLYQDYGDKGALERYYPAIKAYVDSLAVAAPDGIWPDGKGFGDWCPPPRVDNGIGGPDAGGYKSCVSKRSLVNTALYYRATDLTARMAVVAGKAEDAAAYHALADRISRAFNTRFLNTEGDRYGDGGQTANVLALTFGLVPSEHLAAVRSGLVKALGAAGDHLDTGIFGTAYLLDALGAAGRPDTALAVLDQTTYPSFGHQIRLGATTMWEEWPLRTSMETHDHAMFAGIDASLYTVFGGITPIGPTYSQIRIRPPTHTSLRNVDASLETVRGAVVSKWTTNDRTYQLSVQIPVNATAEIDVPLDGGHPDNIQAPAQATLDRERTDYNYAVYTIGAGAYTFTRANPPSSPKHRTGRPFPALTMAAAAAGLLVAAAAGGLGIFARRRRRGGPTPGAVRSAHARPIRFTLSEGPGRISNRADIGEHPLRKSSEQKGIRSHDLYRPRGV